MERLPIELMLTEYREHATRATFGSAPSGERLRFFLTANHPQTQAALPIGVLPLVRPVRGFRPWLLGLVYFVTLFPLTSIPRHSGNVLSRYMTIEAIVERGTLAIERSPILARSGSPDVARIGSHSYSDKPPVLPVLASPIYFLMYVGGIRFAGPGPQFVLANLGLTWGVVGLSSALTLVWLRLILQGVAIPAWLADLLTLGLGFGSLLLTYAVTFNNHSVAAALITGAMAFTLLESPARAPRDRFLAGLMVALAATIDLPAGGVMLAGLGLLQVARSRSIPWAFASGAVGPLLLHAWLQSRVTGTPLPVEMYPSAFNYPGSFWTTPAGTWREHGPRWRFGLELLVGPQGWLTVTPALIFSLIGLGLGAGASGRPSPSDGPGGPGLAGRPPGLLHLGGPPDRLRRPVVRYPPSPADHPGLFPLRGHRARSPPVESGPGPVRRVAGDRRGLRDRRGEGPLVPSHGADPVGPDAPGGPDAGDLPEDAEPREVREASMTNPRTPIVPSPAWSKVVLLLILALDVWWRCHTIGPTVRDTLGFAPWPVVTGEAEPLDCDEAAYGYIGRKLAHGSVMYRDVSENKPPLGYWLYTLAVAIGGANELTIRLMPIPCVLATIVLVWWLGLRLRGPVAGCLAAFLYGLLSTDPYLYGNGANMEHFINFFAVGSLAAMVRAFTRPLPSAASVSSSSPLPLGEGPGVRVVGSPWNA